MARHWEDRAKLAASIGRQGTWGHGCWYAGAIFAILGIIAGAMDTTLGLEATHWFLLGGVTFLASLPFYGGLALAWFLRDKK